MINPVGLIRPTASTFKADLMIYRLLHMSENEKVLPLEDIYGIFLYHQIFTVYMIYHNYVLGMKFIR